MNESSANFTAPRQYEVVRTTWLTRKPRSSSLLITLAATAFTALASLAYWHGFLNADKWMAVSRKAVFVEGEWWRAWTAILAHGDAGHFAANSFLFFVLGFFLYGHFGLRVFPWAALFWGGIVNLWVIRGFPATTQLVGASGVVYWMGGVWLVLYFFLSRQKNLTQRWLRTLGVTLLLFAPTGTYEERVSYDAHFKGFIMGLGFGLWHYYWHRTKFLAAEVREVIVEEDDPGDALPPPQGLQ